MKKTLKILGIIALIAVIGFSAVSCGDGNSSTSNNNNSSGNRPSDGGGYYDGSQELKSGTPSDSKMSSTYGVSSTVFSGLFSNARAVTDDADYKGYYEDSDSEASIVIFVWENKNEAKYNSVWNYLKTQIKFDYEDKNQFANDDDIPPDTILSNCGIYGLGIDFDNLDNLDNLDIDNMKVAIVQYYKKAYNDVPAGTLVVGFLAFK